MNRALPSRVMALFVCLLAATSVAQPRTTHHTVEVHGLSMYVEETGEGPPLVLLHGGAGNASVFSALLPAFAAKHRVICPEQMGHGHTPDADRPFTYSAMAADTAALLDKLGVERADVVGWSDGGIIGLLLAARSPERVRRLVVSGANTSPQGAELSSREWLLKTPPEAWPAAVRDEYARVSPDGAKHWPVVLRKLVKMWTGFDDVRPQDLAAIRAPTLVISGDHDLVRLEHTVELFRSLGTAQLWVLPGTGHATLLQRPEQFRAQVLDFLEPPDVPVKSVPRRTDKPGP